MNHLLNITKKELKELLTPSSIISVLVMVVIFMSIGSLLGSEMEDVTSPSKIGVINGDPEGVWSEYVIESIFLFYESTYDLTREEASEFILILDSQYGNSDEITREMIDKEVNSAFAIDRNFSDDIDAGIQSSVTEYYIFQEGGLLSSTSSSISAIIVPFISQQISTKLISDITDPDMAGFIMNPIKISSPRTYINGTVYEGVTPLEISTSAMGQTLMVPIVIMIVIVMIGSIVISSMGNEKENKTLETLLTMPVKRTTIVSGKLLAAAITGLVFGLAYMIGMMFYINGFTGSISSVELSDYGLTLGAVDWLIIGVMIFLTIFCALGLCMILGAFAKNYKAAQTMTLPISVLAMIPMFVTMLSGWNNIPGILQGVIFAIPFSHPMMVMNNLMFNNMTLVLAGMAYLLIFTFVTIFVTVRLYKSDILLTGLDQTKFAKRFSRKRLKI